MEEGKIPYLNRELAWLDFNARVLEEAAGKNPLMERLRFLAISASNLDEFFMVRVAGVKAQISSGYREADLSGLTPTELLVLLTEKIRAFNKKQYSCLNQSILPKLKKRGVQFVSGEELSDKQKKFASDYFKRIVFPVLTPLAVDQSRPFPKLANKSLNIAVRLEGEKKKPNFAVVQVPGILPRFLQLPSKDGAVYILLENIITANLGSLFDLHELKACFPFRLTRNSDLQIDEETEDLLLAIQKSIKKRKRGKPVRLELPPKCDRKTRSFLINILKIKEDDVFEIPGPIDLTFLSKFASQPQFEMDCFPSFQAADPPADFWGQEDIFAAIRERDRMVHHPYESFNCVVEFARRAAQDPDVLAIKQTLYRVSGNSPIVAALMSAAENGKQVTVLVELKARFDEENNIQWAQKLEEAGCHVIYGLAQLKTHCKILLVVRREEDGIRRYVHMGTGNYNDSTAKVYTDIGLFSCREDYGTDASSLFNVLTGYSRPPEYNKFIVAPQNMRAFFSRMIQREIKNAEKGLPCGITAKINSLVDGEMIRQLYQASMAGVQVRLLVRGICCLIPNLPEVSDTITVHSIVGRFLEHSRIFLFENAGEPRIFMGSADWMARNLDRRVELIFPIEDPDLQKRAFSILNMLFEDNINTRLMQMDGNYQHIDRRGRAAFNCHEAFQHEAIQAVAALVEKEKNKPYAPAERPEFLPVADRQVNRETTERMTEK